MGTKARELWESLAPDEQKEFWNGMSASEQAAFTAATAGARSAQESGSSSSASPRPEAVADIGFVKTLGLAAVLVVGFCSTWWLVAGESWQIRDQIRRAQTQATTQQRSEEASPPQSTLDYLQNTINAREANTLTRASFDADGHFRTQGAWGLGAGLVVDVFLLSGILAWQKITLR